METKTLKITGMMCDACVGHVTKALVSLEGVEKADVSLQNNAATVTYNPAKVQVARMVEAVADEGYEVLI